MPRSTVERLEDTANARETVDFASLSLRADGFSGRLGFAEIKWGIVLPVLSLLAVTIAFRATAADVVICRWFYERLQAGWPGYDAEPWRTLYRYGPYPGLAMGIAGMLVAVVSLFWHRLRDRRELGLFLAALLALGPGLAVNGVLKPYWSRPRPKEIKAFGGTQEYISVWQRGPLGVGKSFPSGHASMGFYLMAPAFVLYRRRPRWALAFLLLGLAGGAVIGLGRVAQGQHFPSDVLWAGGLVYLSGVLLRYLFHLASPRIGRGEVDEARPVLLSIEAIRRQAASEKKDRIPVPQRRRAA